MDIQTAKQIRIADFLYSLGILPSNSKVSTCGTNPRYGKRQSPRSK